jgi:hypothetical protein
LGVFCFWTTPLARQVTITKVLAVQGKFGGARIEPAAASEVFKQIFNTAPGQ